MSRTWKDVAPEYRRKGKGRTSDRGARPRVVAAQLGGRVLVLPTSAVATRPEFTRYLRAG